MKKIVACTDNACRKSKVHPKEHQNYCNEIVTEGSFCHFWVGGLIGLHLDHLVRSVARNPVDDLDLDLVRH